MKKIINFLSVLLVGFILTACQEERAIVGEKAPDIVAYSLTGEEVHLNDMPNKIRLLTFWSGSCGICVAELKELQEVEKAHSQQIKIIAINVDGDAANVEEIVNKHQLNQLLIVRDQLKITAEKYHLTGTPTTYLIDKQGVIMDRVEGLLPKSTLESLIQQG